jgi:antirestriction protein ArdC
MKRTASAARKSHAPDVYQIVTDRITTLLSAGVVPWRKGWTTTGLPKNLYTGKTYRGINPWLLTCAGFSSPYWLTYRQAQERGGNVRKGEKSSIAVFWKMYQRKEGTQPNGQDVTRMLPVLRYYNVFNVEQCDGIDAPIVQARTFEHEPIAAADALWDGWTDKPALLHRGNAAVYRRHTDRIIMPPREQFETPEDYYSVLFHEGTHATGHESRLARPTLTKGSKFGSQTYSKEELVAELGSAYLCGFCGIGERTLENSAAYIASWLQELKSDKTLIVHAAANAQKAADHILRDQQPLAEADEAADEEAAV